MEKEEKKILQKLKMVNISIISSNKYNGLERDYEIGKSVTSCQFCCKPTLKKIKPMNEWKQWVNEWISKSTNQLNKQKSTTNIHSDGDPQKGHKNQLKELTNSQNWNNLDKK